MMPAEILAKQTPQPEPWPTPPQQLLLRVCFSEREEALRAWAEWSHLVDLDHLDSESNYLLPLLHHKLKALGVVSHPWLGRLKGYHRFVWATNQRLLAHAAELLRHFRAIAGDEILVLKGAAMACGYYSDIGLRAMEDVDFMVRPKAAPAVIGLVRRLGFAPVGKDPHFTIDPDKIPKRFWHFRHAQNFRRPNAIEIDVHWRLMFGLWDAEVNERFWQSSHRITLPNGESVRTLDPTDHFFHCCLHGFYWQATPRLRWICDALLLLERARDQIDWQRIEERAVELSYSLRLGRALEYLAARFPGRAGKAVTLSISLLGRTHSAVERADYAATMRPGWGPEDTGPKAVPAFRRFHLHCGVPRAGLLGRGRYLVDFLTDRWHLQSAWSLPIAAPLVLAQQSRRRIERRLALRTSRRSTG